MTTVFGRQLCRVSNLPHRNSVRPLRAVHTIRTVPYGNFLIELKLNYDGVHTTHGVVYTSPFCRYCRNRVVFDFCGIFAVQRQPHGSPFNLYGLSVPFNVFQKFNTNFPRPYSIGRRKDTVEKFNFLHK